MKKKIWIPIVVIVSSLLILLIPIPKASYDDGGTREYVSLTYKIVDWNRLHSDGVYENTRIYFGKDRNKSIDELWEMEGVEQKGNPNDFRPLEFTGTWLNQSAAVERNSNAFADIRITKIYSNCFFATTVIPMPYEIKLNGKLGDEWCVGDQIICTYENVYYDELNSRYEADFKDVKVSTFELDPYACYKPVIYLYPKKETEVEVNLNLDGKLTCTYPLYKDGWKVKAMPDGTLFDVNGQTYNYLYWEGETCAQYDLSKGFCVKGEDTSQFLEEALEKLGLNRKEANEFIVYWLPLMQENPYNIISFQTKAYTDAAKLEIKPSPDTVIRVFMVWQKSDTFKEMPEQELLSIERKGFTVIEWGGTQIG